MPARNRLRPRLLLSMLGLLCVSSCGMQDARERLRVLIAGSLIVPFADLERAYESAHPGVDVEVEAHGSIQVIRHVTELHAPVDVVVPADYALIPLLMYSQAVPESGEPYAAWFIEFASNRLALAYTTQSRYAQEISVENWYEILARPDVRLGISDPRFDASGYRTLMVVQLAETVYGDPTIFEHVFLGQFSTPITTEKEGGLTRLHVPELLEPIPGASVIMRGNSVALIALLEAGEIDFAFEYESVIQQHGLQYVPLPGMLNLGQPEFDAMYAHVQVQLDFQRFSTVPPVFDGARIGYGVTIPSNAPNKAQAEDFIAFLLGKEGKAIMAAHHHPPLSQPLADGFHTLPERLMALCLPRP